MPRHRIKARFAVPGVNNVLANRTRAGLAAALLLAVPLAACSADETKLSIQSDTGNHQFTVQVVDTPETRARGLMYVQELADDAGMLFDFKEVRPVSF